MASFSLSHICVNKVPARVAISSVVLGSGFRTKYRCDTILNRRRSEVVTEITYRPNLGGFGIDITWFSWSNYV